MELIIVYRQNRSRLVCYTSLRTVVKKKTFKKKKKKKQTQNHRRLLHFSGIISGNPNIRVNPKSTDLDWEKMDSDSWSGRLASASRRYQLGFLSPSGEFNRKYIWWMSLFFPLSFIFRFDFWNLYMHESERDDITAIYLHLFRIKSMTKMLVLFRLMVHHVFFFVWTPTKNTKK